MKKNRNDVMGTMPVGKLLATTSIPMMVSMMVQALYNVVDSLFVSRLSEQALNAVGLAFPLQTLMIGFGIGTAVGTNALLSRYLGAKDPEKANTVANTGLLLSILTWGFFAILGLAGSGLFYKALNVAPEIQKYGTDYCTICLSLSLGFFIQSTFERMLTATGRSKLAMICQLSGAVTNIVLDPLFIFGIGPFPRLETSGAAVATVIGQFVAGGLAMMLVKKNVPEVRTDLRKMRLERSIVREIYKIAIPSIIMQCISSVMNFLMNLILISFTETATAVFGVYYKLQSFIFMPVFGLNNGMVPIISYNYGAKKAERLWKTVQLSVIAAVGIMLIGTILFETIPGPLLSIFNASEEMIRIGTVALRTIAIHFPLAGFCIIAGSVFQAVGNPNHSVITSLVRQMFALLPAAWLLAKFVGTLESVWFCFPIAEAFSLLLSVIFMVKTVKNVRKEMSSQAPRDALPEDF